MSRHIQNPYGHVGDFLLNDQKGSKSKSFSLHCLRFTSLDSIYFKSWHLTPCPEVWPWWHRANRSRTRHLRWLRWERAPLWRETDERCWWHTFKRPTMNQATHNASITTHLKAIQWLQGTKMDWRSWKAVFSGEKNIHSWLFIVLFQLQATGSCYTATAPRWAKISPTTILWVQCPSGSICDHMHSWRLSHSLLRSRMHCSQVGKTDLSTWGYDESWGCKSSFGYHLPSTETTNFCNLWLYDCLDLSSLFHSQVQASCFPRTRHRLQRWCLQWPQLSPSRIFSSPLTDSSRHGSTKTLWVTVIHRDPPSV